MKTVEERIIEDKKVWSCQDAIEHFKTNYIPDENEIDFHIEVWYLVLPKNDWHEDMYLHCITANSYASEYETEINFRVTNRDGEVVEVHYYETKGFQNYGYNFDTTDIDFCIEIADKDMCTWDYFPDLLSEDEYEYFRIADFVGDDYYNYVVFKSVDLFKERMIGMFASPDNLMEKTMKKKKADIPLTQEFIILEDKKV